MYFDELIVMKDRKKNPNKTEVITSVKYKRPSDQYL